ncbi:MAG: rRNA maturation RNase YbeY [Candidatus Berkelbacteria bacterium]|nr:rRNA maturation RNase YbeY [Candidatus Berkelbacteria bacterium]
MITIDIDNKTKSTIPATKDIESAIFDILKEKGFDINCEIDIKIVSKDEIQKLNKKYRKLNKPTDVLSFPQFDKPPARHASAGVAGGPKVPILLGDIIICPEMATDDILFLVKHSVLHLLSYHHK